MQRSSIIFIKNQTLVNEEVRKLVVELAEFSQVWIAHENRVNPDELMLATHGLPISGNFQIRLDIPIEVQSTIVNFPSDPVFFLVDLDCMIAALSYDYPLIWINPSSMNDDLSEPLKVINVSNRSSFIIASSNLAKRLDIPDSKFFEIERISSKELFTLFSEAKPYRPHQALQGLLTSEMFRRDHLFGEQYRELSGDVSGYIKNQVYGRLFLDESLPLESRAHAVEEEEKGTAIRMLLDERTPKDNKFFPSGIPDILVDLLSLTHHETSDSTLSEEKIKQFLEFPTPIRAPFVRAIIKSEEFLSLNESEINPLLCEEFFLEHLSSNDCIKLMMKKNLPPEFFHVLGRSEVPLKRLVADYGHARNNLDSGAPIHVRRFEKEIDLIDQQSLIPDLWHTGLRYWRDVSGDEWTTDKGVPAPDIHEISDNHSPEQITDLNREGQRLLSIGLYDKATEIFTLVRASAAANRQFSTEAASRLNIGWSLAMDGKQRKLGKRFISSVLSELAPPEPLTELRSHFASLVEESYQRDLALLPEPSIRDRFTEFIVSIKSSVMRSIKSEIRKRPPLAAIAIKIVRKFRQVIRFLKLLKTRKVWGSK